MKKVRFETPVKCFTRTMEDSECHSPRPFIEKQDTCRPNLRYDYPRPLLYNPDPVQRYECSNSSPYPVVEKTSLDRVGAPRSKWPSNDLELSMIDSSLHEPRNPVLYKKHHLPSNPPERRFNGACSKNLQTTQDLPKPLTPIENFNIVRPENTTNDSNFFIKCDQLNKLHSDNALYTELNRLSLDKENNPLVEKAKIMRTVHRNMNVPHNYGHDQVQKTPFLNECQCHHCVKIIKNAHCTSLQHMTNTSCHLPKNADNLPEIRQHHACMQACPNAHHCHNPVPVQPLPVQPPEQCKCNLNKVIEKPTNLVDKKTWMVEKYQENLKHDLEIEKSNAVTKEKREPTVSDLFKIIKLQNEQLKLLQEKVDKFISTNSSREGTTPIQNYMTEQIALQTVDKEQHKISIGVMTSFEMVRTSTVINKEIVTQSNENAQIQCNKSQISIKEVVSQPLMNFLDGIMPARKTPANPIDPRECIGNGNNNCDTVQQAETMNDDKTLNEMSLYNVQVDNATTPQISPEQSLYLDVRDYSDSESGSDDQSNVGWTYYNKVMTHVNGLLQDSEMPSSASALYRNTRQQCLQMQIDKTNVSVTKRVKFGDDPLGLHQPHIYAATTDTSLKMNQLAAKYLKGANLGPSTPLHIKVPKPVTMPIEMSFATRNYMERHRILQGASTAQARSPLTGEMPRFLDITALKQQPKLL